MLLHHLKHYTAWWSRSSPSRSTRAGQRSSQACEELDAVTVQFSPLVGELLALYCHARLLQAVSEDDRCPQEYQLLAHRIIQQLFKAWVVQNPAGTMEDLIAGPPPYRSAGNGPEAHDSRAGSSSALGGPAVPRRGG
ncbi:hypothetical protein ACFYPK_28050 [Streptomyces halstedii]|uniref:hypothetical protein n=1 Tax=Streptomyces halstedii TaxID=1944 RepID=UPI00345F6671